jgi:PTS system nitrogen regulatory IIA component
MFEGEILTIEEVATYLRVSERTVSDWAQKGEIPAGKFGTDWRFKKAEIEQWVNDRMTRIKPTAPPAIIQIETIISPERVLFLEHSAKRDALMALAANLATAPQIKNGQELTAEILQREELMSTAIGRGIAIPHVRLASITDLVVAIGISHNGISDFPVLDEEPVKLLFMIAAAYNQHAYYLQTLSFFSSHLKNVALRSTLLAAQDSKTVYELLINGRA